MIIIIEHYQSLHARDSGDGALPRIEHEVQCFLRACRCYVSLCIIHSFIERPPSLNEGL